MRPPVYLHKYCYTTDNKPEKDYRRYKVNGTPFGIVHFKFLLDRFPVMYVHSYPSLCVIIIYLIIFYMLSRLTFKSFKLFA